MPSSISATIAMSKIHCTSSTGKALRDIIRLYSQPTPLPPSFLLPAFAQPQRSSFSTSTVKEARKDGNPRRGMSALKSSGLGKKFKLSVKLEDLPQPVARRSKLELDPNHGLWGFFDRSRTALMTPEDLSKHGRAWTVAELRRKDFDDLWKLYWACAKEINRLNTYELERERLNIQFGGHEAGVRLGEAKKTQKAIKHALTERWYQFESARELALDDPEINLYADHDNGEPGYTPSVDVFEPVEASNAPASAESAENREDIPTKQVIDGATMQNATVTTRDLRA